MVVACLHKGFISKSLLSIAIKRSLQGESKCKMSLHPNFRLKMPLEKLKLNIEFYVTEFFYPKKNSQGAE